jgi:hypothetical protein
LSGSGTGAGTGTGPATKTFLKSELEPQQIITVPQHFKKLTWIKLYCDNQQRNILLHILILLIMKFHWNFDINFFTCMVQVKMPVKRSKKSPRNCLVRLVPISSFYTFWLRVGDFRSKLKSNWQITRHEKTEQK